ncbi:MAG: N-formylglutamate amidohydrolase [Fimbriimonadaceae bacterium]|nr:N-formylglutamate amidohydrolase [Alphaproteobacteria bacterium]
MDDHLEQGFDPPFDLLTPDQVLAPCLFGSPHSGRVYPPSFLAATRLDPKTLRKSEDFYVDELFEGVTSLGATQIRAHFPRAYLDVNREPYELDPQMFSETLPAYANTRSIRVKGGLGTIARIVADATEIYHSPLKMSDAMDRIGGLYMPYHKAMDRTLAAFQRAFGFAVLIDCHSMPSSVVSADRRKQRPDFILGDRYATSCASIITDLAQQALENLGYTVARNKPYAGGFITERYGAPSRGVHALQLEVNRSLYMNERKISKIPSFDNLKRDLALFAEVFLDSIMSEMMPRAAAAE